MQLCNGLLRQSHLAVGEHLNVVKSESANRNKKCSFMQLWRASCHHLIRAEASFGKPKDTINAKQ